MLTGCRRQTAAGWVKYSGNPVLGGSLGTCFDVCVLAMPVGFRMWFSWRPRQSIAWTDSSDGIHWSEPQIALAPIFDSNWEQNVNRPVVVQRDDGFHMWYTGQTQTSSAIGYAQSVDGKDWRRSSQNPVLNPHAPWEGSALMVPHVIWDEHQNLFRMWYSGGGQYEPNDIGYATSPDGLHWNRYSGNPVLRPERRFRWERDRVTGAQIVKHGNVYYAFYIGFRDIDHAAIGLAWSRDGITNWQRHPANPILQPGLSGWDSSACYKPYAIFDGKKWMLWYNGRRNAVEQIGLATHDGEDLGLPLS
jgi:beta-1,2-mannobiose phosphorylase / 1,2-beta-oligomannan phosphorylase